MLAAGEDLLTATHMFSESEAEGYLGRNVPHYVPPSTATLIPAPSPSTTGEGWGGGE